MVFLSRLLQAEICKQSLMALRKETGHSFQHCKKALENTNNDVKQAIAWLEAESVKQGWSKLQRSEARSTPEGILALVSNSALPRPLAAITEVSCETDFVARNTELRGFAERVSKTLCNDGNNVSTQGGMSTVSGESLSKMVIDNGQSIGEECARLVSKVGEKLDLRQSLIVSAAENEKLAASCHPDPAFGKFSAVLLYKGGNKEIAEKICRHIIGMKPSSVGSIPELAEDHEEPAESEKPSEKIEAKQTQEEENNDDDNHEEEEEHSEKDENQLTLQTFLFDQEKTVGQLLRENDMEITRFWRVECGREVVQSRE